MRNLITFMTIATFIQTTQVSASSSSQSYERFSQSVVHSLVGDGQRSVKVTDTIKQMKPWMSASDYKKFKKSFSGHFIKKTLVIEQSGRDLIVRSGGQSVRVEWIRRNERYIKINGITLSKVEVTDLRRGIAKVVRNFSAETNISRSYNPGLLRLFDLSVQKADASWYLMAGLGLIGLGIGAGFYFMSSAETTHQVEVDPIKVDFPEKFDGRFRLEIPGLTDDDDDNGSSSEVRIRSIPSSRTTPQAR